jgi:tetratricopeptide (TPR) repeat protein
MGTLQARGWRGALLGGVALAWSLSSATHADTAGPLAPMEAGSPRAEAGTYLAARAASAEADLPAAADLFAQALGSDPTDPWLLEGALNANLGLGRLEEARDLADRMVEAGVRSPTAALARNLAAASAGDWGTIQSELESGRSAGPLVDGLTRAWAWAGQGDGPAAISAFDELAANPGLKGFALYHKALALALSGDLPGAEAILALPESEGMQRSRRSLQAQAQILAAQNRADEALALLDSVPQLAGDPAILDLHQRLEAGEPIGFTLIASPAEGLAEAYLNIAAALADGEDTRTALAYARAALLLAPSEADAALLTASIFERLEQPGLARDAYALVRADDPAHVAAELGRARVLRGEGEDAAALEVLTRLAEARPDLSEVQSALADLLRGMKRFPEAESAYDRAIALQDEGAQSLWYLHFMRALTREGQDDWPGTEEDLRRALEVQPDQPMVLNHLGYSMVERNQDLPEALGMLERAVALRPDSGAIVDSLGWAHFKLGRFEEAVTELERAAALLPTDPVINDHLGDAYWTVGREREAQFQWRRALSFEPTPEEAEKIRRKLDQGLDAAAETVALPSDASGG